MSLLAAPDRVSALKQLCHAYDLVLLYAFGSRAAEVRDWLAGTGSRLGARSSDIDMAYKCAQDAELSVRQKVQLALALESWLTTSRVDLVSLREADPFLAANIIRGERLYAEDSDVADEYELFVLRRAGDLAPFEEQRLAKILKSGS